MPAVVGIPTSVEVAVKIYVTKSEKDSEKLENYESKTNESFVEELGTTDSSSTQPISRVVDSPYVSFESGRPDLQGIIQHEIEKALGRMSINGKPQAKICRMKFSFHRFSPSMWPSRTKGYSAQSCPYPTPDGYTSRGANRDSPY